MNPPTIVRNLNGNLKYVVAILIITLICFGSVASILVWAPKDQQVTLITMVIGFLGATTTTLLNLIKTKEVSDKTDLAANTAQIAAFKAEETHKLVATVTGKNTEQTDSITVLKERLKYYEGLKDGTVQGKAQADAEKDALQKGIEIALPLVQLPPITQTVTVEKEASSKDNKDGKDGKDSKE